MAIRMMVVAYKSRVVSTSPYKMAILCAATFLIERDDKVTPMSDRIKVLLLFRTIRPCVVCYARLVTIGGDYIT